MVKQQYPYKDKRGVENYDLIKHYSDLNVKIRKYGTDEIYDSAIDPYPTDRQYIETDIPTNKTEDEI